MTGTDLHTTTHTATKPAAVSTCSDGMTFQAALDGNAYALAWRCMR